MPGWDAVNNTWNKWVAGYSTARQERLLSRFGIRIDSWSGPLKALFLAFGLAGVFLLSYGLWTFKRTRPKEDALQSLYRDFCRKLARAGLARHPAQGPMDYARMVQSAREDLGQEVHAISELYITLRYGRGGGEDSLKKLEALVKRFDPKG